MQAQTKQARNAGQGTLNSQQEDWMIVDSLNKEGGDSVLATEPIFRHHQVS
jgi:hypothetical protein